MIREDGQDARTVPAKPAWAFAPASNISPAMSSDSGRLWCPSAHRRYRAMPSGRSAAARPPAESDSPPSTSRAHRAAGPVDRRVANPFARQPERLAERDVALQQQGEQVAELGQGRVPPDPAHHRDAGT